MGELKLPILNDPDFDATFRTFTKEVRERNTRLHQDFLHKCYENILFNYGLHWITFDNVTQTFRPKVMKSWIPKPVTNKFASCMRPLVSMLVGTDPIQQYVPVSENPEDVATANVASRIVEIARHEVNTNFIRPRMARWVPLTGNAWLVSGYDKDISHGMVPEQAEQCQGCGNTIMADDITKEGGCPWCRERGVESPGFAPAVDPMGAPVMGQRPRGALFSEIATVFEMEYDHEASSFENSLYAMRVRTRDKEWAKATFGMSNDDLKNGLADSSMSSIVQQRYLESLAFISPLSYQLYFARPHRENRILTTELWINPTMENPEGMYGIQVGNEVVWKGPYKYHTADSTKEASKPLRTLVHFGYEVAPGRVAYRTPADDLVPKNRTRNELECIYKLHSRRAANSILWIPDGSNMSKMVGEEGLIVRYTAMSQVPAPRREAGLETPKFIEMWLQRIDAEMEELSGAVDVLRGEAPAGLEAYSALQALEAKAIQALSEPKSLWSLGWAQWSEQMLGIFKEYAIDEREYSFKGENGAWSVEKFKAADLTGGVRIIPELTNLGPSSAVARSARYEQGVRMGMVNLNDPQERYNGWKILGLPEAMPDIDMDIRAAAMENDAFVGIFVRKEQGNPPAINPQLDNDMVHLSTHRKFAFTDRFRQLGIIGQAAFFGHMAQHEANMMLKRMQEQQGPSAQRQEGKNAQKGGENPESKAVKSEAGAASQPARSNDMGKGGTGKRAARLAEIKAEQNAPGE